MIYFFRLFKKLYVISVCELVKKHWFLLTSKDVDKCVDNKCMEVPLLVWVGINGGLVIVASILTACFEVQLL